jgi:glycosyltransferase involved in cell wall biosynthesis
VLSGASVGAAWRADAGGAAGAVYHAAGANMPLATGLPLVVTLLDLAPWELPRSYQRGAASRFGQRLRRRLLRDAAAVIVGTESVAAAARRLLHLRRDRVRIVPFAPRAAFRLSPGGTSPVRTVRPGDDVRVERERLGLPERYLVYSGRYDARQDLGTLLRALHLLGGAGRPADLPESAPWPPRVLLVGASPSDRASLARSAARVDVGETLAYAPRLSDERLAALVRGARAAILPAVSDATGLPALEAISCGTPVVASAVGALPEVVGAAGILVEQRDPERLAAALGTAWADDRVHERLAAAASERAQSSAWTWADVARATRRIYAEVAAKRR